MDTEQPFKWVSCARTDVGRVRKVNEDACLERAEEGLWVVADGMGGHAAGDVASGMIVEAMTGVELSQPLSAVVTDVEARLMDVNHRLRELASSKNISTIGSTFAAVAIDGGYGVAMWVGDSRVYRVRDGEITTVSQDHAFVEDLVEKGILSREDAASHPQSNLVTRAVGAQDNLKMDLEIFELEHEDTYVLCSDGLDKELSDDEIADLAIRRPAEELGNALVEEALERGARDNVTVISLTVQDPAKPKLERPPPADLDSDIDELLASDEMAEDNSRTDFGRLAKANSPDPLLGDDETTVRRDDLPPGEPDEK